MAHTGPPPTTQCIESGFGSLKRTELTADPIAHPASANATHEEIAYCLKASHAGRPRASSAAYAYGSMDVIAPIRAAKTSVGDHALLVTIHRKKKTSGVVTGASRKA